MLPPHLYLSFTHNAKIHPSSALSALIKSPFITPLKLSHFIGYDRRTVKLREYSASDWEIFAVAPEFSSDGGLSVVGIVGLLLLRKLRTKHYRKVPAHYSESSTE